MAIAKKAARKNAKKSAKVHAKQQPNAKDPNSGSAFASDGQPTKAPLIEQHGVIGNMRSAALVSIDGDVDFYCVPNFDSPSVFAKLLDPQNGGNFRIEASGEWRTKQQYLPDTNILVTRLLSEDGLAEITDFMAVAHGAATRPNRIIRYVRVIKGEIRFRMRCAPRFNYGRSRHSTRIEKQEAVFRAKSPGTEKMTLYATVRMKVEAGAAVAEFTLARGQCAIFTFGDAEKGAEREAGWLDENKFRELLRETSEYWKTWIGQSNYQGRWRETVSRSALILKLLSNREHGALIAAPTFGLPERLGGARNWDYRYSWLRDASFTLYAFMRLGITSEATKFGSWMRERITHGLKEKRAEGPLRPMYRIQDSGDLTEVVLENFSGYRDSRPVRIGNAAQSQLQLDVYGELMDAIYLASKYSTGQSNDGWNRIHALLDWLGKNWEREDAGIWEVRNGPQHFLHSRLMCWVAFDRASRLAQKRSLAAPLTAWLATRDAIHEDIFKNFWNQKLNCFVQAKNSSTLDASVLLMPMMRFISPTDPRWLSTLAAVEEHLTEGGLVYRYSSGIDGLDGQEGTFTPCSFWLIECLARAGQVEKAELMFDNVLGYANHLGLYSEELSGSGEQLGNFPQALTHLALISAATFLDRKLSGNKNETWQ
jgi:GH15 family glucan-1,4-alpha-glucosidase